MINITPDTTAVNPDRTGNRVNRCAAQSAKVDDEGVVPDPKTATVMTTAPDGERQYVVAGVRHAGQHVGHIGDLNDGERVSIHCAVVHGTCLVVPRIVCGDDGASDSGKIIYS
jgi:hypothetical protein